MPVYFVKNTAHLSHIYVTEIVITSGELPKLQNEGYDSLRRYCTTEEGTERGKLLERRGPYLSAQRHS
jgi:hypothetical protein